MDRFHQVRLFIFLALGFFVFAWLMPNHNPPWTSAYQEFSVFWGGLIFLFVIVFLFRSVRLTVGVCGFLVLSIVPIFQFWAGVIFFSSDAWMASIFLFGFFLMLVVGLNFSVRSDIRRLFMAFWAQALVLAAVLSVWVALRQWLLFPSGSFWVIDVPPGGRPFANLAQPNSLATLLCMGLAGVLYLYEIRCFGRISSAVLSVLLIFGVALTQSRTPWVSAAAIFIFWGWKSREIDVRLSFFSLIGWLVLYAIFVLALPHVNDVLYLSEAGFLSRESASLRLSMWGQLMHAALQSDWWGYGWGQVSVAQVAVSAAHPAQGVMTLYSHNILLDLLLWNGLVIGGVVIFLIAIWLLRIGAGVYSLEGVFSLMVAGFILTHAMLEYPLAYAFFLLPLGLVLGVAAADVGKAWYLEIPRGVVFVFGLVGVFLFFLFFREYRVIDDYYRVVRLEEARIYGAVAGDVPEVSLLSEPREYIRFVRASVGEGMTSDQLEWMRKVALRRPGAFALFRYSLALGVNDRPLDACKQLLVLRAQYGQRVFDQALDEFGRRKKEYPKLAAIKNHPACRRSA